MGRQSKQSVDSNAPTQRHELRHVEELKGDKHHNDLEEQSDYWINTREEGAETEREEVPPGKRQARSVERTARGAPLPDPASYHFQEYGVRSQPRANFNFGSHLSSTTRSPTSHNYSAA